MHPITVNPGVKRVAGSKLMHLKTLDEPSFSRPIGFGLGGELGLKASLITATSSRNSKYFDTTDNLTDKK